MVFILIGSDEEATGSSAKKLKVAAYKPSKAIKDLMKKDELNSKLWEEAMTHALEGQQVFMSQIQEIFACICCQDLVYQPVTTECKHNFCKVKHTAMKYGLVTCLYD